MEPQNPNPQPAVEPPEDQSMPEPPGYEPNIAELPKVKRSKVPLILAGIAVIGLLGYGAYALFGHKAAKTTSSTTSSTTQTKATTKDVPDTTTTAKYENGFLGVALTYPSNWTVTEGDVKSSVKLESPDFSYMSLNKGQVTGNFRIYIRKGARDVDGKYIGRGVAIEPSTKLVYTKPALGQRADTYLSLFGLDTTDNFAFFMIAGNFNLNKGDTLGPSYGKEAETYIIAGGFSAKELADDLQTYSVSIDYLKSSNAHKQAVEILKSLQIQ